MNCAMLRTVSLWSSIPDMSSSGGGGGGGLCSSPGSPRISLSMERCHGHDNRLRRVMSENDVTAAGRRRGAMSQSCSSGSRQKEKDDQLSIWSMTFETEKFSQIRMVDGVPSEMIEFQGGGYGDGFKDGSGYGRGSGSDDGSKLGDYYEKMLRTNPGDPLLLRNYARYLHEVEGNTERAEEYYGRAILADPEDGEVLSMYAKLIWEAQGDGERAKSYHERAASAMPDNCVVLGSFAKFLWESMEEEEEEAEMRGESDTTAVMVAAF
ncbi:hypothetical protein MLD38_010627 [Melastoma candidum]|uniref:Uncharacterized protein n=1 Tax=Melastoma candidum TaxID=119954 RepID=A0ACB9R0J7_9MYRT|nr:hypothetical protein MLD38_010627 [Melastoma candidum]